MLKEEGLKELCVLTVPRLGEIVRRRRRRADAAVLVFAVGEATEGTLTPRATATVQGVVSLRMTGRWRGELRQPALMQLRMSRIAGGRMLRRQHRDAGCTAAAVHPHR